MTKRYEEPIEVQIADRPPRPIAFRWRGRLYHVHRLLKYWRESSEGWDPDRTKDHECYRVEAEGGTYDLRFDRLNGRLSPGRKVKKSSWHLARVWD